MSAKEYTNLTVQLPPPLKAWLQQEALRRGVSMTEIVVQLLEEKRDSARVIGEAKGES